MRFFLRIKALVVRWYRGEYVPPDNPDGLPYFTGGIYDRHWTAIVTASVFGFFTRHWKWTIGTVIAIIGLCIAGFLK